MVAKSGCPVTGHTHVNSGHSKRISYSRSGFGFGNVSSVLVGDEGIRRVLPRVHRLCKTPYKKREKRYIRGPVRDIYEAAERHSATLAMFVEHLAKRRGWSARTLSGMLMEPRLMMIYGASVLLPYGRAASFIPARSPRVDGDTWVVDIKRSDGVSRPEWNNGVAIKRLNGGYTLTVANKLLDEAGLLAILEAIGEP